MFTVCIDAGHAKGGDKHGCYGFSEQAHNLAMAQALKAKLEATKQITVTLTRTNEIDDPSLTARGRMGRGKDVFLSMHTNGANGRARGVTVFYSVDLPQDKPYALELAKGIATALKTPVRGAVTRGGKDPTEDYYTVIDTAQDVGAKHVLLSESGFHDNPQDWAAMVTPQGIEAIAEAHAKVIIKLLGVLPQTYHVVAAGDSLIKIAKQYGMKWQDLAKLNNIKFPWIIRAGQRLVIK
jgi:N-acetylmuramoyl-L-alanine amidase